MGLTAVPKPPRREPKPRKPLVRRTPLRPVRKGKPQRKSTLKTHRIKPTPPTLAQRARWDAMKALGCIACLSLRLRPPSDPEIHHLNAAGQAGRKRRGHDETVCLCAWHHRGALPAGRSASQAEWTYGPSLARASRRFRETFGIDEQLLEYQDKLLEGVRV